MRYLPLLVLLTFGCDRAKQGPPSTTVPVGPALSIGDPAPPLGELAWLHGEPVTLAPGKVYVVEFWATWCGPCKKAMPLLNQLAKQYQSQNVVILSVTTEDQHGNDRAAVEAYLAENAQGSLIRYAFCSTGEIYERWMMAAGQEGIPYCMVVDAAGKIAWMGSPFELANVLPKIATGTWNGMADLKAISAAEAEWQRLMDRIENAGQAAVVRLGDVSQPEKQAAYDVACRAAAAGAVPELEAFLKANPWKESQPTAKAQLMGICIIAGKLDEAKVLAEKLIPKAIEDRSLEILEEVRYKFVKRAYNPDRQHLALAVQAAEAMLKIVGENNVNAVLNAAEAYKAIGDAAKYDEMAKKARLMESFSPERLKKVEQALGSFQ